MMWRVCFTLCGDGEDELADDSLALDNNVLVKEIPDIPSIQHKVIAIESNDTDESSDRPLSESCKISSQPVPNLADGSTPVAEIKSTSEPLRVEQKTCSQTTIDEMCLSKAENLTVPVTQETASPVWVDDIEKTASSVDDSKLTVNDTKVSDTFETIPKTVEAPKSGSTNKLPPRIPPSAVKIMKNMTVKTEKSKVRSTQADLIDATPSTATLKSPGSTLLPLVDPSTPIVVPPQGPPTAQTVTIKSEKSENFPIQNERIVEDIKSNDQASSKSHDFTTKVINQMEKLVSIPNVEGILHSDKSPKKHEVSVAEMSRSPKKNVSFSLPKVEISKKPEVPVEEVIKPDESGSTAVSHLDSEITFTEKLHTEVPNMLIKPTENHIQPLSDTLGINVPSVQVPVAEIMHTVGESPEKASSEKSKHFTDSEISTVSEDLKNHTPSVHVSAVGILHNNNESVEKVSNTKMQHIVVSGLPTVTEDSPTRTLKWNGTSETPSRVNQSDSFRVRDPSITEFLSTSDDEETPSNFEKLTVDIKQPRTPVHMDDSEPSTPLETPSGSRIGRRFSGARIMQNIKFHRPTLSIGHDASMLSLVSKGPSTSTSRQSSPGHARSSLEDALKKGIPLAKKGRNGRVSTRIFTATPGLKTIGWGNKNFSMKDCLEVVRNESLGGRTFSLRFPERTLDITAQTDQQAEDMVFGFREVINSGK
jgi:hypothetical protein